MSDSSSTSSGGMGGFIANLVSWGIAKKRPKSIAEADALARPMVNRWVAVAVGVSWVPGSTLVLASVDFKIFHDLAKVYAIPDFNVDAMVVAIGGSVVGRGVAEAAGWAFGVGWLTNPIVAGGITKALSNAIMDYMRRESSLPAT
ncbi:MAG TPA: hypothetical protein VJM32_04035 [Candidatus Saccharimonadales bacterium]|nr:hypothetical protein [Candidatus Saccharimonadales bacterium]